ncbi:hypothetical protein EDB85DRAFT_1955841 [Lactarius pseudohatsudake]|nr:hypothetical protein EDB85DRAFT_1955841 [Lactarius pseudohatsudake]
MTHLRSHRHLPRYCGRRSMRASVVLLERDFCLAYACNRYRVCMYVCTCGSPPICNAHVVHFSSSRDEPERSFPNVPPTQLALKFDHETSRVLTCSHSSFSPDRCRTAPTFSVPDRGPRVRWHFCSRSQSTLAPFGYIIAPTSPALLSTHSSSSQTSLPFD